MDDLIKKSEAIDTVLSVIPYDEYWAEQIEKAIGNLPPTQSERPKGHWIDMGSGQECSECGEIQYGYDNFRYYCAKCGSDNRGE